MNVFVITSVPLIPPWDQGDKNLAYSLTAALSQHRFCVLTARGEPEPMGANLDLVPVYRDRHPTLAQKAEAYWRLFAQPYLGPVIRRSSNGNGTGGARCYAPDLYHFVYQPRALSSWLNKRLPEFQRRPSIHTIPAIASGHTLSRELFFADRVVTLSEYGRRVLQQLGLDNVVCIPPGIHVERWAALRSQANRLKARLGLAGHPVILFPGHYSAGQGADVMLSALPYIAARLPGVRIVFACRPRSRGDQEREMAARLAVLHMGLAQVVHFHNVVADMEPLIGASDLVALPLQTMRDKIDIPTTLLESLAAGKPVIISDLPPMNELFTNGHPSAQSEIGMVVPPGDSNALAQAIVDLMTNEPLRERMGRRGQLTMYERFDIQDVARQYDRLYQEMVYRERIQVPEMPGEPESVSLGAGIDAGMGGNGRYSPNAEL